MDPNNTPTNPAPFGGQTPNSSQPPANQGSQAPTEGQEVTIDFNNRDASVQPQADGQDSYGQQSAFPPSQSVNNDSGSSAVPGSASSVPFAAPGSNNGLHTEGAATQQSSYNSAMPPQSPSPQTPLAGEQNFGQAGPATTGSFSQQSAQQPASSDSPFDQSQVSPQQQPTPQPLQPQMQGPGVRPVEQQPSMAATPSDAGGDKKTIIILCGVAVVLIVAIAVLFFM